MKTTCELPKPAVTTVLQAGGQGQSPCLIKGQSANIWALWAKKQNWGYYVITYINKRKKQISTCFINDIQNIIIKYILEYRSTNEKNGISGAETNFA